MISLIVCSLSPSLDGTLLENIRNTVGIPYEVICVDNSTGRYSIFEAYNDGASRAKYDLLCFMHADILFHTGNWGGIVAGKLGNKEVGVIGVAGAIYKSASPSPWWISDGEDHTGYQRFNLLQHFSTGIKKQQAGGNGGQGSWDEVLVLDGVWLCCRKETWRETPFDEKKYGGFHFYDLDFSMAVHKNGYRNFVSQEILLEHFSAGNVDANWIRSAVVFHKKWRNVLPMSVDDMPKTDIRRLDLSAARNFLRILTYNRHHDLRLWLKYWIMTTVHNPFAKENFLTFIRYGRTWLK
jgi:hypothetical protein